MEAREQVAWIELERIDPSPYQRRRHFPEGSLRELARSIDRDGLIEPVVLREVDERYELIAGERRVRAIREYGKDGSVLARVVVATDQQARRMCAAENLQREDLSAVEATEALVELIDAELFEDEEYRCMGIEPKDRVKRLLMEMDSALVSREAGKKARAATDQKFNKFVELLEQVFSRLPKAVDWRPFLRHDLPLLEIEPEVKEIAATNHLNKSQTKALGKLLERAPDEFAILTEYADEDGLIVLLDDKSGEETPLADLSAGDILGYPDCSNGNGSKSNRRTEAPRKPTPPLPEGKFNLVYADPPWPYDFSRDSEDAIEVRYRTLSVGEIRDLTVDGRPVKDLFADQCVLFLWATSTKLPEAVRIMRAWGFKYRSSWVWFKSGLGQGYWARIDHELLLIGVKGEHPCPVAEVRESSVVAAPKTGHSRKPLAFRERIERTFPEAVRVELFGRGVTPEGWTFWGNEAVEETEESELEGDESTRLQPGLGLE